MGKNFEYKGSGAPFCHAWSTFLCCTGLLVMFPIGIVCMPVGFVQWIPALEADPATDFEEFPNPGCNIKSVSISSTNDNNGGSVNICNDRYTYTFTIPGDSATTYTSETEIVSRGRSTTCGTTPFRYSGAYQAGNTVTCWQPSPPGTLAPRSYYDCGNPECYKILNPSLGHADDERDGLSNSIAGIVFLGLSVLCMLSGCCLFCCRIDQSKMGTTTFVDIEKPGEAMTTTVAQTSAAAMTTKPKAKEMDTASASAS